VEDVDVSKHYPKSLKRPEWMKMFIPVIIDEKFWMP